MKNILHLFKRDVQNVSRSVIGMVVVMGLIIVPCLYAWFNIAGSWDPYGNTGNPLPPYDEVTPFASRVKSEKRGHHDGVRAFTLYYIICFRDYSWPSLLKSSKEISLWFSVTTAFSAAVIFSSKARSANCWTVSCCLRSSLA